MTLKIIAWKPNMFPEPGKCYYGMPNEVYHGLKEWHGSTDLKHVLRSVESFRYEKEQPTPEDKIAFERGNSFHVGMEGIIEDGDLSLYQEKVLPCPTKTITSKASKDLKADNPGCYVLPETERDNCAEMIQNVYRKGSKLNFFDEGYSELSFFWVDPETGIRLKCRPDWMMFDDDDVLWMSDFKTAADHQREAFQRVILNLNYHLSAAMYIEGVFRVTGIKAGHFPFIVCANTPPFEVEVYDLDQPSLAEGHALFRKCLDDVANYEPDKQLEIKTVKLPRWGFKLT